MRTSPLENSGAAISSPKETQSLKVELPGENPLLPLNTNAKRMPQDPAAQTSNLPATWNTLKLAAITVAMLVLSSRLLGADAVRGSQDPARMKKRVEASFSELNSSGAGQGMIVGESSQVSIHCHWIPAGTFVMGGTLTDEKRHPVTLSRGFLMAETECTQAQWETVMGRNPSVFKGTNLPVDSVNWEQANQFCAALTEIHLKAGSIPEGWLWSLPTEAQWEYACRAGSTGDYAGKIDSLGWYDLNSGEKPHSVMEKAPNSWGLFDMHGNVWEWCADWYSDYSPLPATDPKGPAEGTNRVLRGGSWGNYDTNCRSANRFNVMPSDRNRNQGFRPILRRKD
jgi:formylglycine-generating enzyme required for sulfatase activity